MIPRNWLFLVGVNSIIGGATIVYFYLRRRRQLKALERQRFLQLKLQDQLCCGRPKSKVFLVSSIEDWSEIEEQILNEIDSSRILGLDCEWVNEPNYLGKVALLQLGLTDGSCVLVRICKLETAPESLKEALARYDVIKVGVAVKEDAKKLLQDHGICVNGLVDLRHLVKSYVPEKTNKLGLKSLASKFLGFEYGNDWRFRCTSWEDETLSQEHITYAANDAMVSVNIALHVAIEVQDKLQSVSNFTQTDNDFENLVKFSRDLCLPFVDLGFKQKETNKKDSQAVSSKSGSKNTSKKVKPRNKHCTRKTPLYHNATLEAPDGQLLCVCDLKKARWYVEKNLGCLIQEEPLRVRLNFEPSGRPEGPAGEYYLTLKDNVCVVCGKTESYLRKYIVPHEYRKFFPEVMRDHQSHDVLLMCTECHQLSNYHDMTLRRQLAEKCNAPIGADDDIKYHEQFDVKLVRSAARALRKDQSRGLIPENRRAKLAETIQNYFQVSEISQQLLQEAANLDPNVVNENYSPHGKKVVEYFIEHEGIIPLEKLWRQNFLEKMRPKFLPPLWSVDHQKHRLDVRAAENRIDPRDYDIANKGQRKDSSK